MGNKKKSKNKQTSTKVWNTSLLLGVISLLILGAYFPVFFNDFVNYDDDAVLGLVTGGTLQNVYDFFVRHLHSPHYKPLVFWSWSIEHNLFGNNPFVFHFNNLFLHLANSILIFFIAFKLLPKLTHHLSNSQIKYYAFFIALLWGIHPIHVESVAWAVERKDVLYSLFFLGSWLTYLHYIQQRIATTKVNNTKKQTNRPYFYLGTSILLYLLSILSKSMGITLFAIILLSDWIIGRKVTIKWWLEKALFGVVLFLGLYLYGLLTDFGRHTEGVSAGILAQGGYIEEAANLKDLPNFYKRLLIVNFRLWAWLLHTVLPIKLSVEYPRIDLLESIGFLIHFLPLLTLLGLFFAWRKRSSNPYLFWSCSLFIITLSPALSISDLGHGVFLSDRYTYIASLGSTILMVLTWVKWMQSRRKKNNNQWQYALPAVVACWWLVSCFFQSQTWKNSETLWTSAIEAFPNKLPIAHKNRGSFYNNNNAVNKAFADFNKVIEIAPNDPEGYNNRAKSYSKQKKYDLALKDASKAIHLQPKYADAYLNRASLYRELQQYNKAITDCNQHLSLNKNSFEGYYWRGNTYQDMGQQQKAVVDFDKAIQLRPNFYETYNNRGNAYTQLGQIEKALADFTKCIHLTPQNPDVYYNRANLLLQNQRFAEALKDYQKTISLSPQHYQAYYNKGVLHFQQQQYNKALAAINKALQIQPNFQAALNLKAQLEGQ